MKIFRKALFYPLFTSLVLVHPILSHAGPGEEERSELAAIIHELKIVKSQVESVRGRREKGQDPYQQFDYRALAEDLQLIIKGINEQLQRPNRMPREIQPLTQKYD